MELPKFINMKIFYMNYFQRENFLIYGTFPLCVSVKANHETQGSRAGGLASEF